MKLPVALVISTLLVSCATSTPVQSCSGGGPHELSDNYKIGDCVRTPCKLKRKTDIVLEFKFTPDQDAPSIKNKVNAKIAGVPFPFIGVDGSNACSQVYFPDGSKAGCPLKAGQEYLYKNTLKVLEIYPKLKVVVHWALTAPGNRDLLCFNVPAKITS
ncbi:NPC intracellular cholesterol transporter 2 [Cryptotermes secundus]|uniref:NPC intracellular cholesterol transporter 2 n=1 Tax=Cryptotermes secundus TaxID=105785 RepID=UPI000CD7C374|nr:NPC intracellular cholesterol transporter 2 [Cryptotermes secundus]